jgi:hypothetical protein
MTSLAAADNRRRVATALAAALALTALAVAGSASATAPSAQPKLSGPGRIAGVYASPNVAPSAQRDSANAAMDALSGVLSAGEGR